MGEEEVEDMNERIAQEEVELAAMEIQELPPPEEPGEDGEEGWMPAEAGGGRRRLRHKQPDPKLSAYVVPKSL
jgi:hypothetical protein